LPMTSQEALRLEGISKSYAEKQLFKDVNAVLRNGERIVLAAPNGNGKSTLLKMIMGWIEADAGKIQIGPSAHIGYLDQENETLDPRKRVIDSFLEVTEGNEKDAQAELHRTGLFSADLLDGKRVGDLSVGQARKLALARLIASRANLLLLDEPTNHLDFLSLEALESALENFAGTMLAVSHDRRFIENVATRIWRLEDGQLREE
jgi:ATPase subunit of ABC transporter with duplicated ATPase domains